MSALDTFDLVAHILTLAGVARLIYRENCNRKRRRIGDPIIPQGSNNEK